MVASSLQEAYHLAGMPLVGCLESTKTAGPRRKGGVQLPGNGGIGGAVVDVDVRRSSLRCFRSVEATEQPERAV